MELHKSWMMLFNSGSPEKFRVVNLLSNKKKPLQTIKKASTPISCREAFFSNTSETNEALTRTVSKRIPKQQNYKSNLVGFTNKRLLLPLQRTPTWRKLQCVNSNDWRRYARAERRSKTKRVWVSFNSRTYERILKIGSLWITKSAIQNTTNKKFGSHSKSEEAKG